MANGNLCVRCGREQEEHDTNLVIETDEFLRELRAEELVPRFTMSLLDCSDTKRPSEYEDALARNSWYVGLGAGYVSLNPAEESRLYHESRPMFSGHSISMLLSNGRVIDIGL